MTRPRDFSRLGGDFRSIAQPRRAANPGKIEKARDPRHALRRLLPYLRPFAPLVLAVGGIVILYTVLGLAGPYLMGVAIDQFIAVKQLSGLARISCWMIAVYVLNAALQTVADWLMANVSQRALQRLRQDLFQHLQRLPLRFFDQNPAGELMSRLTNDTEAINQAVAQNVTSLAASILSLVGILAAMIALNLWLALASVVAVPLMFWFTHFVARYTRKGFRELQKSLGTMNAAMEEAISGQRVLKAFHRSSVTAELFRQRNAEVYKASVYANSYALLLMPLTNVLGNFFIVIIAGLGGWLALRGLVTVGVIATFISYGRSFIQPLRQLANMYNSIQAALAGAERVFEIIDHSPEADEPLETGAVDGLRGDVVFDKVNFEYQPGVPVIHCMSVTAGSGKTIALAGPTGAGKTTVINLLTRFYDVTGGRIMIDGRDIRTINKRELRRRLGLVLQDTFLFSAPVIDNIRYGRLEATDAECMSAAQTAGAEPFILQLPQGYATQLSERAANLSQGQRQLLAIARAILADPDILILDEATSSVDTRTEARIQRSLLQLMSGRTSFVIAHRLSTIRDADVVLVIDNGQIVERGTHRELLAQRGFYYRLYVSQFKGFAL